MNLIQYWKEKNKQDLAEPDLVKKYQLDEFLEEHKDD